MRNVSRRLTIMVMGVICAATTVKAQDAHRFEIDIPFQFILSGRTVQPGRYVVGRLDPGKPNILIIKNTKEGTVRLLTMQRVESDKPSATSSLVFLRKDGKFYLFQVWSRDEMHGNQIPISGGDQSILPEDQNSRLVRLRAKAP